LVATGASASGSSRAAGRLLHGAEFFGDEVGDLVRDEVAVGEGLVEGEVGEREAGQGRVVVVARVYADGAVRDVDAVAAEATEERQERRRRVAEDAGLAAIFFVKVQVARPQQLVRVRVARVFAVI